MSNPAAVYGATRKAVISARYPVNRIKLVEAIQHREGDTHLSDTVARMLNEALERRGLLEVAA